MSKRSYNKDKQKDAREGRRQRQQEKGRDSNFKPRVSGKKFEMNVSDAAVNPADLRVIMKNNKGPNDVGWYKNLAELAEIASSIYFNQILGLPAERMVSSYPVEEVTTTYPDGSQIAPGIMTIEVVLNPGISANPNSPINVAAQELYAYVRKNNSGAVNYDKTDLMSTLIAMDNAYALYEFAHRVYNMMFDYPSINRYEPNILLYSNHVNPNLVRSAADFKYLLNQMAYKLASINIPDVFDIFRRHAWMFSNVYKDRNSDMAQLYCFIPAGFYKWVEGVNSNPTHLEYVSIQDLFKMTGTPALISSVKSFELAFNTLIDPLLGSQDVGTMSGDIARAFSSSDLISVAPAVDQPGIEPVYNEEVLNQIANLKSVTVDDATLNITTEYSDLVNGPYLKFEPQYIYDTLTPDLYLEVYSNPLLNLSNKPTGDDILTSTRLIASYNPLSKKLTSCGAELVTNLTVFMMPSGQNWTEITPISYPQFSTYNVDTEGGAQLYTAEFCSAFDWAPTLYNASIVETDGKLTSISIDPPIQDMNYYIYLSNNDVYRLNEACMLSLWKPKFSF